jgi:GxxExxY protein
MVQDHEQLDGITEKIIGGAIAVHQALGPGLLESIYRDCLVIELRFAGMNVQSEVAVPIQYRDQRVRADLELDLLVERCVVVEVKAVERLHPVHQAQVITYLKLTEFPAGLLLNFNATTLRAGLKRLEHPDLYIQRHARRLGVVPQSGG